MGPESGAAAWGRRRWQILAAARGGDAQAATVARSVDRAATDARSPESVLRELHARHGDDRSFNLNDYEALGNRAVGESPLARVVREKAEESLQFLAHGDTPNNQATFKSLQRALLQLVRFDQDRLVRSPALLRDLPQQARPLLDQLAAAHLLSIDRDSERVELTHDALLQHWPRLKAWLNDARDLLHIQSQLEEDPRLWEPTSPERQPDALLSGPRLETGRKWLGRAMADRDDPSASDAPRSALQVFVEESDRKARGLAEKAWLQEQHDARQRRLVQTTTTSFLVLCALAAAGTGWLLRLARTAVTEAYTNLHMAQIESDPPQSVIHGLAPLQRHGSFSS